MLLEILVIVALVLIALIVWTSKKKRERTAQERREAEDYLDAVDVARQSMVVGENRVSLPVLEASSIGYRPVGKEVVVNVQNDAVRMENKSTGRYSTNGASVSIPVVKGVRFRVGAGSIRGEKSWQATDTGRLILTDKAIVFEGSAKNERITWGQVSDVELLSDGFKVSKRTGPPRFYVTTRPDPQFAAALEFLLARTD